MSDAKQKHELFWSDFEEYSNDRELDFDKSIKGTSTRNNSYIISTRHKDREKDGYKYRPYHFTLRTNTLDNTLTCKVRFNKDHKEENDYFNFFVNEIETIQSELGKGIKFRSASGDFSVDGIGEVEIKNHNINWKLFSDGIFNTSDHQAHFEWLDNNARLFRAVFRKYYRKFKDSQPQ